MGESTHSGGFDLSGRASYPMLVARRKEHPMATDLTISVEDRPGGLAGVGGALGGAGINIEGVCGMGLEGRGIIHVCVEDGAAARRALEEAGVKVEGETGAILPGG